MLLRPSQGAHECLSDEKTETFFGKVDRQTIERELHYQIRVENIKGFHRLTCTSKFDWFSNGIFYR